ncbi:DUF1364 domain-containing protein [Pseudomonas alliivorans]|nr:MULTISPECIES: DUF1364 domain-containing protein [Pseudomonas syringae group]MEE5081306.1 DUF1364 domain-containing protein [Pseudomonas alliivorans]MEE5167967.1 DUF1364 domain-containing protein [Pseudomonas alliivorans]MEE5173961.1 DUF1364 domain-containing protein [Pseudomonas alliivorans]
MSNKNRDDFTSKTITIMRQRAGEVCSNPTCQVSTAGPCGRDKVTSIGVGAHIHAAAPGGKRYSASMTREERMDIENGIWLCANCSIMIDRDVGIYTPETLRQWRSDAEQRAREGLGRRLGSLIVDAKPSVDRQYSMLYLAEAIAKSHRTQEDFLEGLDSRFRVSSLFVEGRQRIELRAKEPVSMQLHVMAKSGSGYAEGFRDLFDHGRKLELDIEDVSIQGSRLLSHILNEESLGKGKLILSAGVHAVSARIAVVDRITGNSEHVAELYGEVSGGRKSIGFEGKAFDGILSFGFTQENLLGSPKEHTINMRMDLQQWERQPLKSLPYLGRLVSLYKRLQEGWDVSMSLEYKGETLFTGSGGFQSCKSEIRDVVRFLTYTSRARSVSMLLGREIHFTKSALFSDHESSELDEVLMLLEGRGQIPVKSLRKSISVDVEYDEKIDQFGMLEDSQSLPRFARFIESEARAIEVFGQWIKLPQRSVEITGFTPKVKRKKWLKSGDFIKVTFEPADGFSVVRGYAR